MCPPPPKSVYQKNDKLGTFFQNGTDMSCLTFGYDNRHVATRGGDDTLKLWDLRSFKKPVNVAKDLFSRFDYTQCSFSPDDKVSSRSLLLCFVRKGNLSRGSSEGFNFLPPFIVHQIINVHLDGLDCDIHEPRGDGREARFPG